MVLPLPGRAVRQVRLFGKLPAHGDFVSRGLGATERDALDAWLSDALAQARADHGTAFEDAYDGAPSWRYVEDEAGGALAASIDRVGRRFPIWLEIAGIAPEETAAAAWGCEELIGEALSGWWDADRLVAAAAALPLAAIRPRGNGWWVEDADGHVVASFAELRPPRLIRAMLSMREEAQG